MKEFIKDDYCVICGAPVPEGRIICSECEETINKDVEEDESNL